MTAALAARLGAAGWLLQQTPTPPPPVPTTDVALDHYSIRSAELTALMGDADLTKRGIAQGVHSGWLGDWMSSTTAQSTVAGYVTAAAGRTFTGVIYAIPGRDSGGYSAGGFPDRASYLAWVTACRNGSGTAPVWWVLEPDAIGQSNAFTATVRAERQETIRQAVVILKQNPNAKVYIDASMWIGADAMAALLVPAGAASADGFSCNVSNFESTSTATTWAEGVLAGLVSRGVTGRGYVVDTARNGNGPLLSSYPGSAIWHSTSQTWCNPPGRGIGLSARKPAAFPNCHGYLWVKNIGQSDGAFPTAAQQTIFTTNAPIAGTWWQEWFDDFAGHSDVANTNIGGTGGGTTTSDLYTDLYFDVYGDQASTAPPAAEQDLYADLYFDVYGQLDGGTTPPVTTTSPFGTAAFGTAPFGA